jgi:hypothetical protein
MFQVTALVDLDVPFVIQSKPEMLDQLDASGWVKADGKWRWEQRKGSELEK